MPRLSALFVMAFGVCTCVAAANEISSYDQYAQCLVNEFETRKDQKGEADISDEITSSCRSFLEEHTEDAYLLEEGYSLHRAPSESFDEFRKRIIATEERNATKAINYWKSHQ